MVVPFDIASVVACLCIPVEVYREKKQTGMPSYRLPGKPSKGPGWQSILPCPINLSRLIGLRPFLESPPRF